MTKDGVIREASSASAPALTGVGINLGRILLIHQGPEMSVETIDDVFSNPVLPYLS